MTAREALEAAHLAGWNVRKMALQVPQEPVIDDAGVTTPAPLPVPDFYATVRTNPINGRLDVLGVVGSKYEPVQNEASCELLDALVDQSGGAHFETAGALRGGRETFVTMKLPSTHGLRRQRRHPRTAPTSTSPPSTLTTASQPSGSWSRPSESCAPTPKAPRSGRAKASFAIRHTGGARASIAEARNALKLSWRYIEAFEAEAAQLYAHRWTPSRCAHFANTLLEVDSAGTDATARHRRERASGIVKLWTPRPPSHRSPGPGGRPTTRSPNTWTTSCRSAARAPPATPAPPARCATSPRRRQRIAEGPSVPDAANSVTAPAANPGPASPASTGLAGPPFSSRVHRRRTWRASARQPFAAYRFGSVVRTAATGCHQPRFGEVIGAPAAATTRTHQLLATAGPPTPPAYRRGGHAGSHERPHWPAAATRAMADCVPAARYHSVGSVEPSSAASTASASQPWRTASRNATARAGAP